MHIPENYLSPQTCAVLTVVMLPAWRYALQKTKQEMPAAKLPLLGIGAAFAFLGMMFNIPFPGGTTGHAVGGTLVAILLGPHAACLALSMALLLQALLFGDGGILAWGANCLNMALLLPYVGYAVYRLGREMGWSQHVSAGVGAYVGINMAALAAAVEFGVQPVLFQDAAGQALYCPYGLKIALPAMLIPHLTLFGAVEASFTMAILVYLEKAAPQLTTPNAGNGFNKALLLILALIVLVPLGLLAEGTAWGEWGADEIASVTAGGQTLGYVPQGIREGWSLETVFADYTVAGLPEWAGYILSAIIGVTLVILIFKLMSALSKPKVRF